MCGIAAIVTHDATEARERLHAMVCAQIHRGPDDEGEQLFPCAGKTVGLGQRRLAIIDLSPAGHQPMIHPRTGDALTYNGELYNYLELREQLARERGVVYRGHSDTEFILHALVEWGPAAVERFEGMFAFAFLRRANATLLLARDPMGIKPLYYAASPGRLALASELRALVAGGAASTEIDRRAVAGMLAYGAVPEPLTIFNGARAFPPGCLAEVPLDFGPGQTPSVRPRPHWRFPRVGEGLADRVTEREAAERLRATLDRAVKNHLISDVPVGIFLSSGLDSTIMAGLAARHAPDVRTFTVGFADQPDMSESALASGTARAFGLPHADVQITGRDAETAATAWMSSIDQPSLDGLNSYVISKAVRAEGIIVALSGLGGDELLGGYPSFRDVPRFRRLLLRLAWLPPAARASLLRVAAARQPRSAREKAADLAATDGSVMQLALGRRRVTPNARMLALGLEHGALGVHPTFQPDEAIEAIDHAEDARDPIAAVSRYEARYYMGNMLLRDGDMTGMAHSLEIRVPLIDRTMLDLCFALPGAVRLPPGSPGKHLLRVAFRDMLRDELLAQRKRGFQLPIRRWMLGPLRDVCEAGLDRVKRTGALRPEGVDGLWADFLREPESPVWSSAFSVCVLGAYLERMNAG